MNDDRDFERIEDLLRQAAADLQGEYPPTPPIASVVRRTLAARPAPPARRRIRLIRAAALAAAIFVALMLLSPDVRQAVARFFGLETVRIERVLTLPAEVPVTAAPDRPLPDQPTRPALDLAGLTTFAEARASARFTVRVPGYLPRRGQLQQTYFQTVGSGQQVILVYPDFALFESEGVIYGKGVGDGTIITDTLVAGQYALWLSGAPHIVQVESPDGSFREESARLIDGNVLAWQAEGMTYRLETKLSLGEAVRIAESLYAPDEPTGLMTLSEARRHTRFPLGLPTYPADPGQPVRAYVQDFQREFRGAQQVILVYANFTLYEAEGAIYQKSISGSTTVEEAKVGGHDGLWLTGGEHIIQVRDASGEFGLDFRRVEGNVLAWEANGLTYRIETDLSLDEALRIAESIR